MKERLIQVGDLLLDREDKLTHLDGPYLVTAITNFNIGGSSRKYSGYTRTVNYLDASGRRDHLHLYAEFSDSPYPGVRRTLSHTAVSRNGELFSILPFPQDPKDT